MNTMLSASGCSAYRIVFGSNPVEQFGRKCQDEDPASAQDISIAGHFVQQWNLRMRAQEATLMEIASRKLP